MTPGRQLRRLLDRSQILVAPGAYDAITARLVAAHEFDAVYMTGAGTVNAHLGVPDIALGTLTEFVENARRITDVVDLPLICDADTGFGNALNVVHTVRAFEGAGVAGIHIEDQESPKRCGHLDGKRIVGVTEMTGKIRAACDARHNDDFVVIARVDAAAVEGLAAAIDRAGQYVEAGADVVFAEALTSPADATAYVEAGLGAPVLVNMTEFGRTPYLSVEEWGALGVDAVIFPMMAFRMMLHAVDRGLRQLSATGTQRDLLGAMWTRDELYELVGYPEWERLEQRYLAEGDGDSAS